MTYTKTVWEDEVPASSPVKYRVKDSEGNILYDNVTIEVVTEIVAGTQLNAANLNKIEEGIKTNSENAAANASEISDIEEIMVNEMLPGAFTAAGQIPYAVGADALGLVSAGNLGDGLVQGAGNTPVFAARKWAVNFVIGNGLEEIEPGLQYGVEIPANCRIDSVRCLSLDGTSGSIQIDIWKSSYANLPAADSDSITASSPPAIIGGTVSQDSTLSGWTKDIAAGDWLYIQVDSVTDLQIVVLSLAGHQL